jgi:hypothetical protein
MSERGELERPARRRGRGASAHVPGCACVRCTGFPPGNELSLRHGAYSSPLRLSGRADELAEAIRPHLVAGGAGVDVVVRAYAIVLARVELASAAIEAADRAAAPLDSYQDGKGGLALERLRTDLRRWLGLALKYSDALGLTPASAARLARDAAQGVDSATAAQARLRRHLEASHELPGRPQDAPSAAQPPALSAASAESGEIGQNSFAAFGRAVCAGCGESFPRSGRGRPRRFCTACRPSGSSASAWREAMRRARAREQEGSP